MGRATSAVIADRYSPEWVIFNDLLLAYNEAVTGKSRTLVFLEARYEWTGWEKFQRVVIFDFAGKPDAAERFLLPSIEQGEHLSDSENYATWSVLFDRLEEEERLIAVKRAEKRWAETHITVSRDTEGELLLHAFAPVEIPTLE